MAKSAVKKIATTEVTFQGIKDIPEDRSDFLNS